MTRFRTVLMATVVAAGLAGGWAVAQTTAPAAKARPAAPGPRGPGPGPGAGMMGPGHHMMGMGCGMGHGKGMGQGMGMGHGMCPMMLGGPDAKIEVKNVDKGVSITVTSNDPAAVIRMQKMAEAMRLMHEAMQ